MLLTETINKSTTAIQSRRIARQRKQDAETYTKALILLSQQHDSIMATLECAKEIKDKKLVDKSVFPKSVRDDLKTSVEECGAAINEGNLTLDSVKLLQTKGETFAKQLKLIWKEAATNYAEGTRGYLLMISNLTQEPAKSRELGERIAKTIDGSLSIKAIEKLVNDVTEAKVITDSFSLSPTIEAFLKKVSSQQATVTDLTPEVMKWLTDKKLLSKLIVRFN